jgi:hypothetical protein
LWLNAVGASAGALINRHVVRQLAGSATAGHADTGCATGQTCCRWHQYRHVQTPSVLNHCFLSIYTAFPV